MRLLVDADIMVFRCGFAAEYQVWHLKVGDEVVEHRYKRDAMTDLDTKLPGVYSRTEGEDYMLWSETNLEPLSFALQNLNTLMGHVTTACGGSEFDVEMFLSGKTNFRYDVATTKPYKGNRDRSHRPTHEQSLRNYIIENWPTTIAEDEEADDLLGIAQTADPNNTIIVSLDKDLDQIPGLKYNFVGDRSYEITEAEAHYNFHIQLMAGDSTDNIPGLPRIGVGRAAQALHGLTDPVEQLAEVWRMYQIHSGVEDPWKYLHEQGQLLHIRREVGQLWSVPESFGFPKEEAWDSQELSLY